MTLAMPLRSTGDRVRAVVASRSKKRIIPD
jgi:hypothetical protein